MLSQLPQLHLETTSPYLPIKMLRRTILKPKPTFRSSTKTSTTLLSGTKWKNAFRKDNNFKPILKLSCKWIHQDTDANCLFPSLTVNIWRSHGKMTVEKISLFSFLFDLRCNQKERMPYKISKRDRRRWDLFFCFCSMNGMFFWRSWKYNGTKESEGFSLGALDWME